MIRHMISYGASTYLLGENAKLPAQPRASLCLCPHCERDESDTRHQRRQAYMKPPNEQQELGIS